MTIAFVNNGTLSTSAGQTTLTPALPASRAGGNLMLSYYTGSNGRGVKLSTATLSNGWVLLYGSAGSGNLGVAWRIVDGLENAPVWQTGTGSSTSGVALVAQYSGNHSSPIGASGSGVSPSLTTAAASSFVAYVQANANSTIPTLATGFTSNFSNGTFDGNRLSGEQVSSSGTTVTPDASAADTYLVELKSILLNTGSITQTLGRVTQAVVGVEFAKGTATQTLGRVTQAGIGNVNKILIAQTLGRVTQAAVGRDSPVGTIIQTLGRVTQAAVGKESELGPIIQTLGRVTQRADFIVSSTKIFQTLGRVTQAAAGWTNERGTINQTLGRVTQVVAAHEAPIERGPILQTLGRVTQVAGGYADELGPIAQTLGRVTQRVNGVQIFVGTITQTLGRVNQVALGAQLGPTGPLHTGSFYSWRYPAT